jgi:hypothetical protein
MKTCAAGLGLLALAACTESSGESLSLAEKTALNEAVATSGALTQAGPAAGYGAAAVFFLPNIGSLSAGTVASALNASLAGVRAATYEGAVGFQIIFTPSGGSSQTFTGVFGWAGLNVATSTVNEVVVSGALTSGTTPIGNGSTTPINGTQGFGVYFQRSPAETYAPGSSGSFVLTTASFTGTQGSCGSFVTQITSCEYRLGTMTGNFAFTANRVGATGTYNQSQVTFDNIPAVRITVVE